MSFLAALAARAAGTAATVEPRLPSRYEREFADPSFGESVSEIPARAAHNITTQATMPESPQPAAEMHTSRELHTHTEHQDHHHHYSTMHVTNVESQRVERVETIHERERERETRERELHTHEHTTLMHEPSTTILRERESEEAPLRVLLQPRVERILERLSGAAPQYGASRTINSEAEAPPSIRVTIGRVDVRAVTDAAPVKSPAPKKAVFTLDDYIRLRRDGQR